MRLDIAEWALGTLGIRFRTVGGARRELHIVMTRNWTVCRTIPGAGARPTRLVDVVLCPDRRAAAAGG
jgi:hypothetical protein